MNSFITEERKSASPLIDNVCRNPYGLDTSNVFLDYRFEDVLAISDSNRAKLFVPGQDKLENERALRDEGHDL